MTRAHLTGLVLTVFGCAPAAAPCQPVPCLPVPDGVNAGAEAGAAACLAELRRIRECNAAVAGIVVTQSHDTRAPHRPGPARVRLPAGGASVPARPVPCGACWSRIGNAPTRD